MPIAFSITLERADQADVIALIDELDAYQKPLYPAESHHGIDIGALSRPNVLFAVARDERGAAVGCGAIVLEAGYGEVKRSRRWRPRPRSGDAPPSCSRPASASRRRWASTSGWASCGAARSATMPRTR
jgi:hypothetical protein